MYAACDKSKLPAPSFCFRAANAAIRGIARYKEMLGVAQYLRMMLGEVLGWVGNVSCKAPSSVCDILQEIRPGIDLLKCMDDSRDETQDGKKDVDQEICAATTLKEHAERGKEDGDDDLDDVSA